MKKLLFAVITVFGIQVQAAELKDLFPFTCALMTKGPTGHDMSSLPITYSEVGHLSYGIFPISPVNNSSFEFLYEAKSNRFRAQYRRYETKSEKRSRQRGIAIAAEIARKNGDTKTAEKLTNGFYWGEEHSLTTDFAEEWVTVDRLMTGEEYRFSTPELPGAALVCMKDPVMPKR